MTYLIVPPPRSIEYVPQLQTYDCWIACLAMVTGRSYKSVHEQLFQLGRNMTVPLANVHMPRVLGDLGQVIQMRFVQYGPDWNDSPSLRIALVQAHYVVVRPDGTVHDPARGPARPASEYPQVFDLWEIVGTSVSRGRWFELYGPERLDPPKLLV